MTNIKEQIDDVRLMRESHMRLYDESMVRAETLTSDLRFKLLFSGIIGGYILPTKRGNLLLPRYVPFTFFRGERKDYGSLKSSIYRDVNSDDVTTIIRAMKIEEFGILIRKLNRVKIWENPPIALKPFKGTEHKNGLFLDVEGIAQHYGLSTHYLDFTNNIDIALFFACTKIDESGKYYPLNEKDIAKDPYGVLYSFAIGLGPTGSEEYYRNRIRIMPIQPFLRSYSQSGFSYYDDGGQQPEGIVRYTFKHDETLCREIFDEFHGGLDLFPNDGLPWLSSEIQKIRESHSVSESAFKIYCSKNGYRKKNAKDLRLKIINSGFSIGKKAYDIKDDEISKCDKEWCLREYYRKLNYDLDMPVIDTMIENDNERIFRGLYDDEISILDRMIVMYILLFKSL